MSEIQVHLPAQMLSVLWAVAVGGALCLGYDVFRVARLFHRPSNVGAFVQDIAWWLAAAVVTYGLMLVRCRGFVRVYVLLGESIGFVACRLTLSRLILTVAAPISRRMGALWRPIRRWGRNGAKKIQEIEKNLLQGVCRLLYNFREHRVRVPRKERSRSESRKKAKP